MILLIYLDSTQDKLNQFPIKVQSILSCGGSKFLRTGCRLGRAGLSLASWRRRAAATGSSGNGGGRGALGATWRAGGDSNSRHSESLSPPVLGPSIAFMPPEQQEEGRFHHVSLSFWGTFSTRAPKSRNFFDPVLGILGPPPRQNTIAQTFQEKYAFGGKCFEPCSST